MQQEQNTQILEVSEEVVPEATPRTTTKSTKENLFSLNRYMVRKSLLRLKKAQFREERRQSKQKKK